MYPPRSQVTVAWVPMHHRINVSSHDTWDLSRDTSPIDLAARAVAPNRHRVCVAILGIFLPLIAQLLWETIHLV